MKFIWGLEIFCYLIFLNLLDLFYFAFIPRYWALKFQLIKYYFFQPAYVLSRQFQEAEQELIYGEAPLFTLARIFRRVNLTAGDHLVDLGSGRGLPVFLAALFWGARATGVEIIPRLVENARRIAGALKISPKTDFIAGDLKEFNLPPDTSVVYIAGTTFTSPTLSSIAGKLEQLPVGCRIVSLSTPIPSPRIKVLGKEKLYSGWGRVTVYYQVVSSEQ